MSLGLYLCFLFLVQFLTWRNFKLFAYHLPPDERFIWSSVNHNDEVFMDFKIFPQCLVFFIVFEHQTEFI